MSTNPLDKVPSPDAATTWSQSQSSNEYQRTMGPISPPYAPRPLDGSPPGYQSRQNVGLPNSSAHHATEGGPLPPFDASQAYNSAAASHHAAEGGPLPPFDASQAYNSAAAEAAAGAEEKRGIMGHPSADSSSHPAFRAPQAPRIAVTDPLADMRLHNLSKPVGLGAKSDWPSRERPMASAQAYPPGSNLSGENTPRIDGLPINSNTGLPIRPTLTRQDSEVSTEHGYEDFEDGFNWSDDEAVEEAARFEEEVAQQRKLKIGRLSLYSVLRFLAVTFIGNLIVSCLLIIPVVVIQFVYRPAPYASHRDFVADNVQAWFIWAAFNLHVMWWLHFFVGLVPRVGVSLVQIIWGTANQDVKSIAEFYGAIRQYISPITYAAMAWGSWAILFNSIYGLYSHTDPSTTSRARYLYRIYQVVEFFFFFTLTVCAEKILIKMIAMSFHKSAYAERIDKVTAALRAFDRLKDYRPKYRDSGFKAYGGNNSGRSTPMAFTSSAQRHQDQLSATHAGNGSGEPSPSVTPQGTFGKKTHAKKRSHMQIPMEGAARADLAQGTAPTTPASGAHTLKSRLGRPARVLRSGAATVKTNASRASKIARVALTDPFSLLSSKAVGVGADVNSPQAAKRLAKRIFVAFRGHHRRTYLIPSDFEPAFPTVAEARDAFSVFDRDGNGDISQSEIKNTVLATYKERRALGKSMQDVNHAVGQLESIFYIIVFIIMMFEAFAIFNVDISKTLTTFYTLGIAFAFIFKESAQNVFDSIIFLFVTHPFDTGDRIAITVGTSVMVLSVKRMSLLSSQFTVVDGTDLYVANSVLAVLMITNYRRSGYQWEAATMQIAFDTKLEQLDKVEKDMIHWLATEPERMFEPSTAIVPQKIEYMRSIEITIGMTHRRTWQDWGMRWYCRNAFVAALCYYMKKHGVKYVAANQPIIYWVDDAAALPPSYHDAAKGENDDTPQRRPSTTSEILSPYDDSFDETPPASPNTANRDEQVQQVPPAKKSYMGFAPPPDELEGTGLRRRKARAKNKGVTTQGGDG